MWVLVHRHQSKNAGQNWSKTYNFYLNAARILLFKWKFLSQVVIHNLRVHTVLTGEVLKLHFRLLPLYWKNHHMNFPFITSNFSKILWWWSKWNIVKCIKCWVCSELPCSIFLDFGHQNELNYCDTSFKQNWKVRVAYTVILKLTFLSRMYIKILKLAYLTYS